MADPVSWAMIASAGLQAAGSLIQGSQGYKQGMTEAGIAGENANIERNNAANARLQAAAAEEAQTREARQAIGSSVAASAQAGVGTGGTAGRAIAQSADKAKLDAMNISYGGELQAEDHLQAATNYEADKRAAKRRANGAKVSGIMGAASAALNGVANYGGYQANQKVLAAQRRAATPGYSYPTGGRVPYGFGSGSGYGYGSGP